MKIQAAKKFTSSANKDRGTGVALPAVKCSIGANVGQLYLMDNAFLFLEKPPLSFMYEDVEKITFDRNQSQQKSIKSHSFDFKIKLSNGKSQVPSSLLVLLVLPPPHLHVRIVAHRGRVWLACEGARAEARLVCGRGRTSIKSPRRSSRTWSSGSRSRANKSTRGKRWSSPTTRSLSLSLSLSLSQRWSSPTTRLGHPFIRLGHLQLQGCLCLSLCVPVCPCVLLCAPGRLGSGALVLRAAAIFCNALPACGDGGVCWQEDDDDDEGGGDDDDDDAGIKNRMKAQAEMDDDDSDEEDDDFEGGASSDSSSDPGSDDDDGSRAVCRLSCCLPPLVLFAASALCTRALRKAGHRAGFCSVGSFLVRTRCCRQKCRAARSVRSAAPLLTLCARAGPGAQGQ